MLFMKSIRYFVLILLMAFCPAELISQEKPIEVLWFDCVYAGYLDGGEQVRKVFQDFEQALIDDGLLENGNGSSYRALLVAMSAGKVEKSAANSGMVTRLLAVEDQADNPAINECHQQLKQNENYAPVIGKTETVISDLISTNSLTVQTYASGLLEVHSDLNFDTAYGKMLVFIGLDIDQLLSPRPVKFEFDDASAADKEPLQIVLVDNDRISIDGVDLGSLEELKKRLYNYGLDHPYTAIYDLSYPKYADAEKVELVRSTVIEIVDILREDRATTTYGKSFKDLTPAQQFDIEEEFPMVFRKFPKSN